MKVCVICSAAVGGTGPERRDTGCSSGAPPQTNTAHCKLGPPQEAGITPFAPQLPKNVPCSIFKMQYKVILSKFNDFLYLQNEIGIIHPACR